MLNLIPYPQNCEEKNNKITLDKSTKFSGDFLGEIALLKTYLQKFEGNNNVKVSIKKDNKIEKEGYAIKCQNNNVSIFASSESGVFYASQTLLQLLTGANTFTACDISDRPQYSWRGFMLDSARHFWTLDDIFTILKTMANLKMNKFHWHLTDDQGWRAEIKKYPLLTTKGTTRKSTGLAVVGHSKHKEPTENKSYGEGLFYSVEDMKAVVDLAKSLHIDVVPEVDMPGHLVSAIACYPDLACNSSPVEVSHRWGVMDKIGCCGKDDIYVFVKDVIDELSEIFPYEYFHIGGDEVPKGEWKKCPACQAKIKELGLLDEEDLQGYFNNQISQYLITKGKHMIGWNEILNASNLDKKVICQWWTGAHNSKEKVLNWLNKGGKVILSHSNYVYMDHPYAVRPLKKTYNYTAKTVGISDKSNVLGFEIPQWTEYVRDREKFDFNTFARLITYSEVGWLDDDKKDYDGFENRLESLRNYFEGFGFKLAPKQAYRGKCLKFFATSRGWKKWRENPNFEVELSKNSK